MKCAPLGLDTVLDTARAIVTTPPTKFGFSDIGDVLVSYLRNEIGPAAAVEKMQALHHDYVNERARAAERAKIEATSPKTIFFVGKNATWARVSTMLDLAGTQSAWMRHVRIVAEPRDLVQMQGLRGPEVWWVNWGATMEQKIFCRTREFRPATAEEAGDAIERLKQGWKR